jgi:hypothetical protein
MRMKEKLTSIRLLVPFLLLAAAQVFAQATASDRMPAADPVSVNTTQTQSDVVLISDRTFLMKSIEGTTDQSVKSPGCSSSFASETAKLTLIGRCVKPECAQPPPGCFYGPPDRDQNGCPINCGPLVCGPEQ